MTPLVRSRESPVLSSSSSSLVGLVMVPSFVTEATNWVLGRGFFSTSEIVQRERERDGDGRGDVPLWALAGDDPDLDLELGGGILEVRSLREGENPNVALDHLPRGCRDSGYPWVSGE